MKKNLCLFLAVVLALALIAPVFVEEAEAETVQVTEDAVPLGDAPEEVDTISADPAEVPLEPVNVPDPTDVPAPVVTDAPVVETTEEPTPVVTDAPVPEVTEAPAPEVTEAPADEPEATEEPAGDQGIALASLDPELDEESETVTVKLMPCGGTFPYEYDQRMGYIEVDLKNGDRTLQFVEADQRAPQRDGYKFKGWFTGENDGDEVTVGTLIPEEAEVLYAHWERIPRTIALHVMNGNFTGSWPEVQNLQDQPSVDVTLGADDILPESVNDLLPVRSHGSFDGWYTEPATEELKSEEGGFGYWHTVEVKGQKVDANTKVPEGVSVLYAVFNDTDTVSDADKRVTIYLDWNGINGLWGKCLTLTRTYNAEKSGYVLTAGDLAVASLNWDSVADHAQQFNSKDDLTTYWGQKQINGYTFKGWAKSEKATAPDMWPGDVVTNGQSLYAVWTKEGESSDKFDRVDPAAGPLQSMHIEGPGTGHTSGSMDWTAHPTTGSTITFSIASAPARATFKTLTWTVNGVTVEYDAVKAEPVVKSIDNFELTANGRSLTIKYTGAQTEKNAITLRVNVSAENIDGTAVKNSGVQATIVYIHSWGQPTKKQEATCTENGFADYTCSVCGEQKHEVIPGHHNWEVVKGDNRTHPPTCEEAGSNFMRCNSCAATAVWTYDKPLGHDYKVTVDNSSCSGRTTTYTCQRKGCGHSYSEDENGIDNHNWSEYWFYDEQATCVSAGSKSHHCLRCGAVKDSQPIGFDRNNHTWTAWQVTSVGTVAAPGTEKRECTGCHKTEYKAHVHTWSAWTTTVAPTVHTTGKQTRTCTRCKGTDTQNLPKLTGSWQRTGGSWYYMAGGQPIRNDFVDGDNYYVAANGVMQTGWINLGGTWYYANGSGLILKNQWFKSGRTWYWLAADGKMATGGPVNVGGADYFFTGSGAMITGWINVGNGNWYYASGSGAVIRNQWLKSGRTWYWLKANGLMAAGGLERIGGADYFFNGSGAMLTGWINLGGGNYMYANGSGAIVKNQWVKCGRAWYYLKSDGMMARNEYVGSYWVNNAGVWV